MIDIRCRLGIHNWRDTPFRVLGDFGPEIPRICTRCHKVKYFMPPPVAQTAPQTEKE